VREIVLDTETTGIDPGKGHRIVEIGCVEIINLVPTGRTCHTLINPERDVPEEAFRVHGHATAFLRDKPIFEHIVSDFLGFIAADRLVIHNAEFDVRFIDSELARLGLPPLAPARVLDTLALARRKHPRSPNSLDALSDRYGIDRSRRIRHGALLDAEILAEVYAELLGGRQRTLEFALGAKTASKIPGFAARKERLIPIQPTLSATDLLAHAEEALTLGPRSIWSQFFVASDDSGAS
jgi:DNA polymerase-3 subunit epsilon